MSNKVLIDEITMDPLVRGYTALTNAQISDSLNAVDRPASAPIRDVLDYAIRSGVVSFRRAFA